MRLLHITLAVLVLAWGVTEAAAGEARSSKPTAAQVKRIKELLEEVRKADYTGWDYIQSRNKGDNPTEAGEELLEMGAVTVPFIVEAAQVSKCPFNAKVYLTCLLGELAVTDKAPSATFALCKLLELWSSNARWQRDNEAEDFEGRSGDVIYLSVMKRSELPGAAALALMEAADPKSVPSLTKTMANLRLAADRNYSTEPRTRKGGEFSIEVMRVVAHALAGIDDDAARSYIDKCSTSSSLSLRTTCSIAKAARMVKNDPKGAEEFLRERCDLERNAIAVEEYKRFILEYCKKAPQPAGDKKDGDKKDGGDAKDNDKPEDKDKAGADKPDKGKPGDKADAPKDKPGDKADAPKDKDTPKDKDAPKDKGGPADDPIDK